MDFILNTGPHKSEMHAYLKLWGVAILAMFLFGYLGDFLSNSSTDKLNQSAAGYADRKLEALAEQKGPFVLGQDFDVAAFTLKQMCSQIHHREQYFSGMGCDRSFFGAVVEEIELKKTDGWLGNDLDEVRISFHPNYYSIVSAVLEEKLSIDAPTKCIKALDRAINGIKIPEFKSVPFNQTDLSDVVGCESTFNGKTIRLSLVGSNYSSVKFSLPEKQDSR